ncbi:hypothetical protein SDC9_125176 [bioreactor metagenome]|uniref:Uncharacterized protein n=1 Tax=bioreactor metagenome TaxID=1076179 RepID=A0A645CMN7_9ZZZZ
MGREVIILAIQGQQLNITANRIDGVGHLSAHHWIFNTYLSAVKHSDGGIQLSFQRSQVILRLVIPQIHHHLLHA